MRTTRFVAGATARRWRRVWGPRSLQHPLVVSDVQAKSEHIALWSPPSNDPYQESAHKYAESVSDTLVLIDGRRIAELMIEAHVRVSAKKQITIPEIDNDYFES